MDTDSPHQSRTNSAILPALCNNLLRRFVAALLLYFSLSSADAQLNANLQKIAGPGGLSAAWVNNGEDKILQEELRAAKNGVANVRNSVWDGANVNLFGAKNEVVEFNLVLEAAHKPAEMVSVSFNQLVGTGGAVIGSVAPTSPDGIFDWTQRNIENFYVRYLEIKGLSFPGAYGKYDERHVPVGLQRPWSGAGKASGTWNDRPNHNKHYPDIAVPLELVPTFSIAPGQSQSIWSDIYIPASTPPGKYSGTLTVKEGNAIAYQIPVTLTVRNFTLPDVPTIKTMLYLGDDINLRYTGQASLKPRTPAAYQMTQIRDRHFQVAHRHKIALIDSGSSWYATSGDAPGAEWIPRLNGQLFSAASHYAGPGTGVGNDVYSIGTYGQWNWKGGTKEQMWAHTNNWESWFRSNSPATEHFLYLIDESPDYAEIETWASWMVSNPGPGKYLKSFATVNLVKSQSKLPDLNITATTFDQGDTAVWNKAVKAQLANPDKEFYLYNGTRPSQGTFALEDDGVALREMAWAQYLKGVQRWFYWQSTYYNDFHGGRGQTNVFDNAATFSGTTSNNSVFGEVGKGHSNGNGVLFYPGTDLVFSKDSYGVSGPIASLRLKFWRRGIQDVDYLVLANKIDPAATQTILHKMVPKALWDYGLSDPGDPTWVATDISWSINPNDWESARSALAHIIDGQ